MNHAPPPLPSPRRKLFVELARISWVSVIIAVGANILIQAANPHSTSRVPVIIMAALGGTLTLLGVVSGFVALCGVRSHGRKGILWPAVTGLGLWLLLFALALPNFLNARRLAASHKPTVLNAVRRVAGARRIQDTDIGFSFDLPEGYEPFSPETKPRDYKHAFFLLRTNEPARVLLAKPLGGVLKRERLKTQDIPKGSTASLTTVSWRGLQVNGIRVPEKLGDVDYVTFNVQIPLRTQGLQLGFGGPAESEKEIRAVVECVLATLEGETSW